MMRVTVPKLLSALAPVQYPCGAEDADRNTNGARKMYFLMVSTPSVSQKVDGGQRAESRCGAGSELCALLDGRKDMPKKGQVSTSSLLLFGLQVGEQPVEHLPVRAVVFSTNEVPYLKPGSSWMT
jgi:hypothetical protein